jgi:hypothetical protein
MRGLIESWRRRRLSLFSRLVFITAVSQLFLVIYVAYRFFPKGWVWIGLVLALSLILSVFALVDFFTSGARRTKGSVLRELRFELPVLRKTSSKSKEQPTAPPPAASPPSAPAPPPAVSLPSAPAPPSEPKVASGTRAAPWSEGAAEAAAAEEREHEESRLETSEAEAEYVNIAISDTTEQPFRPLGLNEGLYTNLVYKLVVSMGMTPDLRFSGKRQQETIRRPEMDEVVLDVVLTVPVNIEILGSSWACLRWPAYGPSTTNAEFEIRAPLAAEGNVKLLIFYEHDLLFCGDLTLQVKTEALDWPADGRPIRWVTLNEVQTFELSLFRRFRDLDRDCNRRLNISVHHRSHDEYELVFFIRSTAGKPAAYPLTLVLPREEIIQVLSKTRAAMRLLVEDDNFRKVSSQQPEYSGRYSSATEAAKPDEALAYGLIQKLLQEMAIVGHELWGTMFGSEAGQRMEAILSKELTKDGVTIQIWISDMAQDFILPWVWLYRPKVDGGAHNVDQKNFWGYRYVIEQIRDRPHTPRPQSTIPAQPLRISGALHNFTSAGRQRAFFNFYNQQYPTFKWEEIAPHDLGMALQKFDSHMLYLYCHGHTEKILDSLYLRSLGDFGPAADHDKEDGAFMLEYINTKRRKKIRDHSYIQIEDSMLKLEDLRLFKPAPSTMAPLVFLNMCESAEFYPGATDNLVDVFLQRGAGGVIGTEMPMLTVFGDLMARQFFELYLSPDPKQHGSQGQGIGHVLWLLRRRFLNQGNPLAFAYTYFGDATTKLRPAIIQRTAEAESPNPV